jgi:hypothetical protein
MHPEDFTLEAHAAHASINAILGSPAGGYTFEYYIEGGVPRRIVIESPDSEYVGKVIYQHDTKGFWKRIAFPNDGRPSYENAMQDSGVLAALLYSLAKGHKVTCEDLAPMGSLEDECDNCSHERQEHSGEDPHGYCIHTDSESEETCDCTVFYRDDD